MSSAEDTTPLTASPSANGTSATEEFRVEPGPDTASASASSSSASSSSSDSGSHAQTTPPPSEQTPDEPAEGAVPEPKTKPLPKVNAVAHEVRVKVTGARPGSNPVERELFAEDTTTVLVFEKGGVIRLVAAVAPGQLLFLTNEESKREVVAQVTRKRAYKPTECYVELEFTEPAPKFWGMEFSAATALLPKDAKQVEAAALVASAETSEDDPAEVTPAPSADDVAALKKEIDALRSRLNSLQTQASAPTQDFPTPAPPQAAAPSQPAPEAVSPTPMPPPTLVETLSGPEPEAGNAKPEIAPAWMPAPTSSPSPTQELAEATQVAFRSLPVEPEPRRSVMTPAEHAMLPQPALDFSASLPKKRKRSFRARGNFTPGFRSGVLRLAFLSVALVVTIIGAAWYKQWLPWKPAAKKISVATWSGSVSQTPQSGAGTIAPTSVNPAASTGSGKPSTTTSDPPPDASTGSASTGGSETSGVHVVEPTTSPIQPSGHGKATPAVSSVKHSTGHSSIATPARTETVSVSGAEGKIVPPKLLKSARAVASLEDLRDFETGAVVIDALVDTSGIVTNMNVLSGPPSLREPAMAALRDYRYEPATRNGMPIPAHVTVRIQFHFE